MAKDGRDKVKLCVNDPVAQSAEQRTFNPLVLGSSPSGVTTEKSRNDAEDERLRGEILAELHNS
jgi:hypothetical protein